MNRYTNPSLQKRLAIGLAAVLIPVLLGQWLLVGFAVRRISTEYVTSRLDHDAETLLANMQFSSDAPPELPTTRVDPIYLRPWSGHYYQVRSGAMVLRSRSLWDKELPMPDTVSDGKIVLTLHGPKEAPLLVLIRHFYRQGATITVLVAEDMTFSNAIVEMAQLWYAIIALLGIGILLVLQREMVRRSFYPLEQARVEIQHLEQGEQHTLTTVGVPVEILPFVREINRLLAVLADRLKRSREASGNMAHTIKTPLTVLLQLTEGPELELQPLLRGKMQQQIKYIGALIVRVLKQVRVAGSGRPIPRLDLSEELVALVETMRQLHRDRSVQIEARILPGLVVMMDREDFLELVGNLLDNACKWAKHRVRCTVTSHPQGLQLIVEDDGPGCPPEYHQHILERGGRVDQTAQGYGIGLAVVREIVSDCGGVLRMDTSVDLGGFCVQVQLALRGMTVSAGSSPLPPAI